MGVLIRFDANAAAAAAAAAVAAATLSAISCLAARSLLSLWLFSRDTSTSWLIVDLVFNCSTDMSLEALCRPVLYILAFLCVTVTDAYQCNGPNG